MTRSIHAYVLSLAAVYCFGALACSSSNDPSTSSGAGAPATGTAGAPATGVAGAPAIGTAGAPATGVAGAATTGTAGAGVGGAGGAATGAAGAATGAAGAATGTAGTGGGGASTFTPLCAGLTTAAGPAPTKAGACTAADPQLCYKTCGPESVGFKSETCTAGAYVEESGCNFPQDADYSCFKLPTTLSPSCPAATPVASAVCSVAPCTPCADSTGHYFDSTMTSKVGYCVCPAPAVAGGTSKWSCATTATAWPCPMGQGC
jgi:hypothetical protein